MKKSDLIRWLEAIMDDPEVIIADPRTDGVAQLAQVLDEVWAVPDAAMRGDERIFWEKDDPNRPARYPGDDPDDPAPVIALVLR